VRLLRCGCRRSQVVGAALRLGRRRAA
jgi:hypothetical protein